MLTEANSQIVTKTVFTERLFPLLVVSLLLVEHGLLENPKNSIIPINNCTCGEDYEVRGRVIGGTEVIESEFPWQVALYYMEQLQCGASLINNNYILSAAHCFKSVIYPSGTIRTFDLQNMTYILGGHNLGDVNDIKHSGFPVLFRKPSYTVIHPLYKPETFFCDIALSKFDKPIENYRFNILPACLPPAMHSFINMAAVVSGWGVTAEGSESSKLLMKTDIRVLPNHICKQKLKQHFIEEMMMCAAKPGHDACQGDSGGPLVSNFGTNYYYQIGIVSYGIGCGNYDYPGVYTRVNRFLKWIIDHTKDATYCKRNII